MLKEEFDHSTCFLGVVTKSLLISSPDSLFGGWSSVALLVDSSSGEAYMKVTPVSSKESQSRTTGSVLKKSWFYSMKALMKRGALSGSGK